MQKPALLACLLTVLGACASDRLIGTAFVDGGPNDNGSMDGARDEEALIAAAKALEGSWIPRPNQVFEAPITVKFQHRAGTRGGTYEVTCRGDKCFPPDASALFTPLLGLYDLAESLTEGEYKLFEINERNEVHGLLTGADNFGFFLFVPQERAGTPVIEISNVPFIRPTGGPGSGL